MAKVAGYKSSLQIYDGSAYVDLDGTEVTIEAGGDIIDVTELNSSGYREKIQGLKTFTVNAPKIYDSGNAAIDILKAAYVNGDSVLFMYFPSVGGLAGVMISGSFLVETFTFSSTLDDAVKLNTSFPGTGALTIDLTV
jgi:predicted secreted protein